MRIHQLTMSAFGPFAGTEVVEFEELNEGGIFLIAGATGAGKTSILDAVCFALFGQVPGDRGVKTLRSGHSDPHARPEVVLDVTLSGRRFEVRRSPEWQRPKRRGTGTTTEKAAASLMEIVQGHTRLISSRAQEVGNFLADLLGMSASQFQQVAMLPQGEFQTFLRASSQERHDVLQQLFRTERFTRIEDWVHGHSRRLRAVAELGEADARRLIDTLSDRAGVEPPGVLLGDSLAQAASEHQVLPWARSVVEAGDSDLAEAAAAHETAKDRLRLRRGEHDDAARLQELQTRRERARAALARLEADGPSAELARSQLDGADRAAHCLPLLGLHDDALRTLQHARSELRSGTACLPEDADPAELLAASTRRLARLDALGPREHELRAARTAISEGSRNLGSLLARRESTQAALAELPARRAALVQRVEELQRDNAGLDHAERDVTRARERAAAAAALPGAEAQLERLRQQAADARDNAAAARERLLAVMELRLAGMAAELAGTLHDGEPCHVCGSSEHPAPARPSEGAVDQEAQQDAQAEADALRAIYEAAQSRVQEAELVAASLRHESEGLTPAESSAAVQAATAAYTAVSRATEELASVKVELTVLEESEGGLQAELRSVGASIAQVEGSLAAQQEVVTRAETELFAELGEAFDLAEAAAQERQLVARLTRIAQDAQALSRAESEVARLEEAVRTAAADHGFDGLPALRDSLLAGSERARLGREVRAMDEALADARRVLGDPELADLPEERPDLPAIQRGLDDAAKAESACARAHHVAQERVSALHDQLLRLERALGAWAPAREEFLTADAMSKLVRGMGADNQLQLRLSSYVLATRLDQVLAAANERLAHMREQRYHLERTGDASRRGSQAGLGLQVVDDWTGEARDPATLSGGETFVVSLALALGLSDVVSSEAGGVRLGTLFIDEGFGMLDPDTLDDVMDRLDGLRAGGRTVGVVSHVTELRTRIPTQLHVDKHRAGSSVRLTTLVG